MLRGFDAVHVPFKGGPEVAAGRVDFMSVGISSGLPFICSGRLITIAVSTLKRSTALPDVPITTEAGYPNSDYTFWNGMLVPAKTPRVIVDRLHAETLKVLKLPSVIEKFEARLREHGGNRTSTARSLGIDRGNFHRLLKRLDLKS